MVTRSAYALHDLSEMPGMCARPLRWECATLWPMQTSSPLSIWPALLPRDQLSEYLGLPDHLLAAVCTVMPVDFGAEVFRWSRAQLDLWAAGPKTSEDAMG